MFHDIWFDLFLLLLTGYIILGGFVARFVWTVRSVRSVTRRKRNVTDPTAFHYHTGGETFKGKRCQYPDACEPFTIRELSTLRQRLADSR